MSSIVVPYSQIKIYDQRGIEFDLERREIDAIDFLNDRSPAPFVPWCSRSYTLHAIYEGSEEIGNRIVATRIIPIPVWPTCMAHFYTFKAALYTGFILAPSGAILALMSLSGNFGDKREINFGFALGGMLLTMVATVCSIATCYLHHKALKRDQFEEELSELRTGEIILEAILTAEERIKERRAATGRFSQ